VISVLSKQHRMPLVEVFQTSATVSVGLFAEFSRASVLNTPVHTYNQVGSRAHFQHLSLITALVFIFSMLQPSAVG